MANDYYRNQNNRQSSGSRNGQSRQNGGQNGGYYRQPQGGRPMQAQSARGGRPVQNGVRQPSPQRKRTPEQIAAARKRAAERRRRERNKRIFMLSFLVAIMVFLLVFCIVKCSKDDPSGLPGETGGGTTSPETNVTETTSPETVVTTAPETVPPELAAPVPTFKADLSAYEMYMNPTGAHRDAYLIVVNANNPLAADYVPPNLVGVKSTRQDGQRPTQQLQEYAAKALEALMLEAEACGMVRTNTPSGYPLSVMSAYRTYEYQGELFNRYVNNEMSSRGISRAEAEKIVATYSNRPGTSEHQTGLCVDMHTLSAANQVFKNEPEAKWLAENCHKFGFILRYPEDKLKETGGIMYEPWHFRYVGRYHATRMKDMGLCLEEYAEYLKNNG